MTDTRWVTVYFPHQVKHQHQQLLTRYKMPPPPPRSSLPVKTSRPSSRNSVVAEKMSGTSRSNRTLPPRPAMAPQPSGRMTASSKPTSGSLLNISSKTSMGKSGPSRSEQETDIFYSSDSELGHKEREREAVKVVKRTNSQLRRQAETKPKTRNTGGEFFEQIDSGWTSRDSSSMDRSSSVSLEEKMDELELGKMRKNQDMMRSELNLPSQFVGFGALPDQVYNKAVRKGFEFSLMVVGASGLGKSTMVNSMFLTDIYADGVKEGGKEGGIGLVTSEPPASEQTLRVETHHRFVPPPPV